MTDNTHNNDWLDEILDKLRGGQPVSSPLEPWNNAKLIILQHEQQAIKEKLDLLFWQYKELNDQSVQKTFLEAYNRVVDTLTQQTRKE